MAKQMICSGCGKKIDFNATCKCRSNSINRKQKYENDKLIHSRQWRKKRLEIIKRDVCCQRCLIKDDRFNTDDLTVHHIISRHTNKELTFEDSNLITVCRQCNSSLGTRNKLDFEWKPKEVEMEYNLY